jgi:hypothetical protein
MLKNMRRTFFYLFLLFICSPLVSSGYSVLSHEAIIDVSWDKSIRPALLQRFPQAGGEELIEARAYAYGGSLVADIGYYPFGAKLFTDLVHYVRSGDFVTTLIDESQDINEYAFALGALCHYYADRYGHPLGTNKCAPIVYPKVGRRFGREVTYAQHPLSHIRTEFGFDVLQTARGNYASEKYHDFIGFKIARPVLERAFLKTYGLDINKVFLDLGLAIDTYRWIIVHFFPTLTRMAWASKKNDIQKTTPGITRRKFERRLESIRHYREYGKEEHDGPGFSATVVAWAIKIVPKVGPLRKYKIKMPGPEAEDLFMKSFDTTTVHYIAAVALLSGGAKGLPNVDFDTGNETCPGEYVLADQTYGKLLLKLKKSNFHTANPQLRKNILSFYSHDNGKVAEHVDVKNQWKIEQALQELGSLPIGMK